MNEFTASNGISVERVSTGGLSVDYNATVDTNVFIPGYAAGAVAEFFRAEEDERLGRWRWPENPDYVIYRTNVPTRVRVLRETGLGELEWVNRGDERSYEFCHAARAYFAAHPQPKPWHGATPGESWVLVFMNEEVVALTSPGESGHTLFTAATNGAGSTEEFAPSSEHITAGRRIYPEATE